MAGYFVDVHRWLCICFETVGEEIESGFHIKINLTLATNLSL